MTSEVAIMNQRALVFAADSATTVSYFLPSGKRTTRYFKGANKLFQLSAAHPVGLMIYGSGSLHDVPWELVIREFRRSLGNDSCDTLATYTERFFDFVRTNTALFPDSLRLKSLIDAAVRGAIRAWSKAEHDASTLGAHERPAALSAMIHSMLGEWREKDVAPPLTASDVAAALAAHAAEVAQQLTELGQSLIEGADAALIPPLSEIGLHAAMKSYEEFLNPTGVVIGGYGETEFFPSFEQIECMGFLDTHFIASRKVAKAVTRENFAYMDSFAIGSMIDTFRMGIGPETFESVTRATLKTLREFAMRVRDVVAPGADIPNLQGLVDDAASAHQSDWYGSSARTHYWPLARVIGALPVAEMATLAKTLIELESLKERVTQESESVAGPIDVAAISKHDGFLWIDRKHYFRPELNPRFFTRQQQNHGG